MSTIVTYSDLNGLTHEVAEKIAGLLGVEKGTLNLYVLNDVLTAQLERYADVVFVEDENEVRPDGPETEFGGLIGQEPY
jgi:menaquinone-dependent protoporphyrinogen IX oxidase